MTAGAVVWGLAIGCGGRADAAAEGGDTTPKLSTAAKTPAPPPVVDPEPEQFEVWGIDVSHHQHSIDWGAVAKESKMKFAYLKATEGATHVDDALARNWKGARAAGLAVGAYHYYSFCSAPEGQAANYLAVLPKDERMLPPVLDVEHLMNCPPDADPELVRSKLRTWLDTVERATGRKPMIYATRDVLDDYILGALDNGLWVRHTPVDAEPVFELSWVFWQYDDRWTIAGIDVGVDQDVFRGTAAELDAMTLRP
jgi:lysozyme